MAIARDAVTDGGGANSTSHSFSHTCSGSDRFLAVLIKLYGNDDITSVTYNGSGMTHILSSAALGEGTRCKAYGLIAPATGSNTLAISRTSGNHIVATAVSYTGVSQSGQPEASAAESGGDTCTPDVTVVSADAWLVGGAVAAFGGAAFQDSTPGLLLDDNGYVGLSGILGVYDSDGTVGTGSQTITMTRGEGVDAIHGVAFALAPAGGGGGGGGNPWYYYAQQRVKTSISRRWERTGYIWAPSYAAA